MAIEIVEQAIEFHDVANIFPMMGDDDYSNLVVDIEANGLREPIWLHQGKIIDGRNRYRACQQLDIEPVFREWDGHGSLVAFVVSLNLQRRHLTSSQKAMVALDIEKHLSKEVAEKERQRKSTLEIFPKSDIPLHAASQAATLTGTNAHYVTDAKKIVEQAPELKESVVNGTLTIPEAKKLVSLSENQRQEAVRLISAGEVRNAKAARNLLKQEARQEAYEQISVNFEHYKIHRCSVASLHEYVEPNSIDVILTDPPYSSEYLYVYSDLREFAEYALRPGGSLLVMTGQSYLPQVLERLDGSLVYHWTLAYLTPGGQSAQLWQRKVNTFWKPLLWFVKDGYSGEWTGDVCKSKVNDNDKKHHHWGQSESGMADIIERFTLPGQTICDPFVGGGTTCAVAASLKRFFVGCDIDASCVEKTRQRVQEVLCERI